MSTEILKMSEADVWEADNDRNDENYKCEHGRCSWKSWVEKESREKLTWWNNNNHQIETHTVNYSHWKSEMTLFVHFASVESTWKWNEATISTVKSHFRWGVQINQAWYLEGSEAFGAVALHLIGQIYAVSGSNAPIKDFTGFFPYV